MIEWIVAISVLVVVFGGGALYSHLRGRTGIRWLMVFGLSIGGIAGIIAWLLSIPPLMPMIGVPSMAIVLTMLLMAGLSDFVRNGPDAPP